MRYYINSGSEQTSSKTSKLLFGICATLAILASISAPTFADPGNSANSNASACGAVHAAQADVNGNFGFLGSEGGAPGSHGGAVGQDPGATGYNNSHTDCQASN